jgi:transcriptional regulator with XRE-family HTH domain
MEISNETKITGEVARHLRTAAGESQRTFWERVGFTQSGGCKYEAGTTEIPKAARTVIFLRYVAGIEFDVSTDKGAAEVMRQSAPARQKDQLNKQALAQLSTPAN